MERNRRTFIRRRATKSGNCLRPIFMHASGRNNWRLQLRRALSRGNYEIRVRVQRSDGSFQSPHRDADAFSELTIYKH
jgi:hypothetical protein